MADTTTTTVVVHWVCCDANKALCGTPLTGGDQYVHDAASCPLCDLAINADLPCGAPGCDVGRGDLADLLDLTAAGDRPANACADPTCPGNSDAIPAPPSQQQLCPICRADAFETAPHSSPGPDHDSR